MVVGGRSACTRLVRTRPVDVSDASSTPLRSSRAKRESMCQVCTGETPFEAPFLLQLHHVDPCHVFVIRCLLLQTCHERNSQQQSYPQAQQHQPAPRLHQVYVWPTEERKIQFIGEPFRICGTEARRIERCLGGMGHGIGAENDHSCGRSTSRTARERRERVSEVDEADREGRMSRTVGPSGGTATKADNYAHWFFRWPRCWSCCLATRLCPQTPHCRLTATVET